MHNDNNAGVHVTLEALMKDNDLKNTIKDLVRGSGRSYPPVDEGRIVNVNAIPEKKQVTGGVAQEKRVVSSDIPAVAAT